MRRKAKQVDVKQYIYDSEKRVNNPPVGLVTAETDSLNGKVTYQFDPHLDPELEWAGKTEGLSFDVETVSLHVHEKIDSLTIIEAVHACIKDQRGTEHSKKRDRRMKLKCSIDIPKIREALRRKCR